MRPSSPPAVITSSPFCSASIMAFCSFAFFICGRIIMKYSTPNMSRIRIMLSKPPPAAPPAPWAYAGLITMEWLRESAGAGSRARQVPEKAGILARFRARLASRKRGRPLPQTGYEFGEPAALDRRTHALHQLLVVKEVVQGI